jgi:hypothetical protein
MKRDAVHRIRSRARIAVEIHALRAALEQYARNPRHPKAIEYTARLAAALRRQKLESVDGGKE